MAMGTERSKSLHNFTLPCELRWGSQRFLRCMKVNSDGKVSPLHRFAAGNSDQHHHRNNPIQQPRTTRDRGRGREIGSSSEFLHGSHKVAAESGGGRRFSDDDDGIAAMREKVMFDLQTAADKMKDAIFKDGLEEGEVSGAAPPAPAMASAEGELNRPWNLRTRRAAFKTSASRFVSSMNGDAANAGGGGGEKESAAGKGLMVDAPKPNSGLKPGSASVVEKSPRLRSGGGAAAASGEKREQRPKFSVALSKSDIEEDFYSMVGHRPPRRPKKRAKNVQRQLDALFPGLWLTEVTPDMYKVSEIAP